MAMSNYQLGEADAQDGYPFCPEYLFGDEGKQAEYAQGFLSVKPDNAAALSFVGNDEPFAELYTADLAVDEAQYTPRPGYDF